MGKTKKHILAKYFIVILGFLFILSFTLLIYSCNTGLNIGEANKVLSSFDIEWPEGFEGKCGSKYPLTVPIKALAQDESVYKYSDVVDIIPTNVNVEVVPSQVKLTDGLQTVELVLRHNSEDLITTDLRISGGGVITTLHESVTVYPNVTGLTLNSEVVLIHKDDNFPIDVFVEPADAWDKTVIWSSEDENIAKVNESGIVTGINYGTTTIKAKTTDGGYEATCDVEVTIVTWHTMLGGNYNDWGYSVQQISDGGYIVAGYSYSSDIAGLLQNNHGINDYYIVRLKSDGSAVWHTMIGGSEEDEGHSIQQTSDGGYIVVGYSRSDITGLLQNHHEGYDYYVVKLSSDGNIDWHTMLGGVNDDYGYSIQQTSDGGYIVAGYSYSTDITGLLENNNGHSGYYIVKLNSDGSISWHTMIGGNGCDSDYSTSIKQTSDGGYILIGSSYSTDITELFQKNQGNDDYYVVKLSSDGSIAWQTMLGGSNLDCGISIQQTSNGGYIVVGSSESTDITGLLENTHGYYDIYIAKLW